MTIYDCQTDPLLMKGWPSGIYTPDPGFRFGLPILLVYASCHGRTLMTYLANQPAIRSGFNLLRLETGPMQMAERGGQDVFNNQSIHLLFGSADVVVTYNMGARMGNLALDNVSKLFSKHAKVITFTAPNCSCFWPVADGYTGGMALYNLWDKGVSKDESWNRFVAGDFDPMFPMRYRLEIGRLTDKDTYHDIGLSRFVQENYKKIKLWMSASHPSYIPMAYVGNCISQRLGMGCVGIDEILRLNYMDGIVGGQPETNYEWKHYKLEYPMRHDKDHGGIEWYRQWFDSHHAFWESGGTIGVPAD